MLFNGRLFAYKATMDTILGAILGAFLLVLAIAWVILPFIIMSKLDKLARCAEEQNHYLRSISINMEVTARALTEPKPEPVPQFEES